MLGPVDDLRFGGAMRAVRRRRRLSQAAVARRAGVAQSTVSRLENGDCGSNTLATIRAVAGVLAVRVELDARWHGPALARLLDSRHAALQDAVVRTLTAASWAAVPEATFSIFGERGSIDVLGWHADRRVALIIEVKTEVVDLQDLLSTLDRKRRLAPAVCRERGWQPDAVGVWVVVRESRANRTRVAAVDGLVAVAFPHRVTSLRRWLRDPVGPLAALTFFSDMRPMDERRTWGRTRDGKAWQHAAGIETADPGRT